VTVPALFRLPLGTLAGWSHDGRVFRSFDHLILPKPGALLLVPVWVASGDLRRVIDGCPVPWEEVFDVLDAPAAGVSVGDPEVVPTPLRALAGDDWQLQVFRMARRLRSTRRFVHSSGMRFADI
jgi:hypothetical protein